MLPPWVHPPLGVVSPDHPYVGHPSCPQLEATCTQLLYTVGSQTNATTAGDGLCGAPGGEGLYGLLHRHVTWAGQGPPHSLWRVPLTVACPTHCGVSHSLWCVPLIVACPRITLHGKMCSCASTLTVPPSQYPPDSALPAVLPTP